MNELMSREDAIKILKPFRDCMVVRCKECVHSYVSCGYRCCSYGVCVDCVVDDDFFCAKGKRRTDEAD